MTILVVGDAGLDVIAVHDKQIFVRGEVVRTVPESQIVEALIEEAMNRDWS
ncbi:hypothetical protein ACFQ1S_34980 [Kibdelosporangium lantanae]|uniref:Uncharacterized protein n=1 Tax=Kibdelosporangium lantanae TaxID=1497396 RepID=A0ABW3MM88_9PSEU